MAIDSVESEPGSTDNRLSLSVSEYPFIEDWEDSKEYTLTITVRQQAAGEFEVVSASPTGEAEEPETEDEAAVTPESATPEEGVQTEEAPVTEEEETPAGRMMRRMRA